MNADVADASPESLVADASPDVADVVHVADVADIADVAAMVVVLASWPTAMVVVVDVFAVVASTILMMALLIRRPTYFGVSDFLRSY